MIPHTLLALLLVSGAPLAAAPASLIASALLDEEALVDQRPEVKEQLATFKAHLKKKGLEDPEAIGVLDQLMQEFPDSGPKDRAAIVKQLKGCFSLKRNKEIAEGIPDDRIYMAAAVALGRMGPESVKTLNALIGTKNHKKNLRLQAMLAQSLGKTKSPDGLKTLLGLLKHKDAPMQAAGAEALGNFFDGPLDTRKDIFSELLKTMMGQKSRTDDVTDLEAQERWNTISGPIIETLQKLTRHGETNPVEWQSWWNDNKKKDWDAAG
jgi:hypothetical protein